eukprot:scaffold94212_cov46-Cyclotella_meneghiniana.AAC.1
MADRTQPCIVLGPTGNIQGGVFCYNLTTKRVVERRTVTPLPMPDRVIKRVIKLGERAKQKRTSERLEFLNRHKERFAWDTGESETQDLVEPEPRETDDLLAEIPGVRTEEDYASHAVVQVPPAPTDLHTANAALANANLEQTSDADEIAGVNDTPRDSNPVVTDDEDDGDEEGEDDDASGVEYIGDNLANEDQEAVQVDSDEEEDEGIEANADEALDDDAGDESDDESSEDEDSNNNDDPPVTLRRSQRNRG